MQIRIRLPIFVHWSSVMSITDFLKFIVYKYYLFRATWSWTTCATSLVNASQQSLFFLKKTLFLDFMLSLGMRIAWSFCILIRRWICLNWDTSWSSSLACLSNTIIFGFIRFNFNWRFSFHRRLIDSFKFVKSTEMHFFLVDSWLSSLVITLRYLVVG